MEKYTSTILNTIVEIYAGLSRSTTGEYRSESDNGDGHYRENWFLFWVLEQGQGLLTEKINTHWRKKVWIGKKMEIRAAFDCFRES